MYAIEVRGADEGTLIFTVTDHGREPWQVGNTTIYVPPDLLEGLAAKLQARLQEVQQLRAATPVFTTGESVLVTGNFRHGQHGTVIDVQPKTARLQQRSGEQLAYTVAFADGATWTYNASELERAS
jgi:hypothetical protein